MQYLDEPFFNQLRTIEQLGYVVWSSAVSLRDVIGCRFVVQSPKQSCEYIRNSFNKFIADQTQKINSLSDEDFKTNVESIITRISEKDYNLSGDFKRMFQEISTHKYLFDRQQLSV